ncbi:MAG TPA: glycosyltransferase [Xanthobacteraceae bacterium]|nr:glycosyltransferase [Xanthobacteraceae bacterium]
MTEESTEHAGARALAGTTILQAIPIVDDDWLGVCALRIANGLLRAGARALVAGAEGALVGELQALGGEWIAFDFQARSPLRRFRGRRALAELLAAERVDLVHTYGIAPARLGAAAVPRSAARLLTSYLGTPPRGSWFSPPHAAMARGEIVLAVSQFAASLIAERHALPTARVRVIPPSIDTEWFDAARTTGARIEALRQAWRIPPECRLILMPGRLAPGRGHLTLVDAARVLATGGLRRTIFVIAGATTEHDGYAEDVDRRITAQGLRGIFRNVGHCPDMPAAYALADLVVLPIERAPLFNSIAVEAQAMARPVIASALGALPYLVRAPPLAPEEERTGWLVPPHDPVALARAIAAALALAPAACEAMRGRARAFIEAHFSDAQVTAATLWMYSELLDKGA